MREILFRAKQIDTRKWIEGFIWGSQDPTKVKTSYRAWYIYDSLSLQIHSAEHYQVVPETIGQYTGLKDTKDNKIFEGDIIDIGDEYGILEVYYDKGSFLVDYETEYADISCIGDYKISPKIIGNIHDNPELLES